MKNKTLILITLMCGTFMAAIDASIVNVSLPVMRTEFDVRVDEIEWVITSYMVAFSLFIPLINWVKSRIGYYNLYLLSVAIFTLGSLLCSLAIDLPMLVIARVIQAIGGGAISPTSLAIVSETFPKEERGSAIGWWGLGNVMGPALGPTLGGVLTQYLGWPSIFYVNIPVGIVTILLTMKHLKFLKNQPRFKYGFDIKGFAFFGLFIIAIQYAIAGIAKYNPLSWHVLVGFSVTVIALILFVRSARRPAPLLDLSVFRSGVFLSSIVIVAIRSIALYGGLFFLPFLLQGLLGFSEFQSAMLMLPNALVMIIVRPFAGRYADKGAVRNISVAGIILVSLSMLLFSRINVGSGIWLIIVSMVVRGVGMGILVAPVSTALLNAVSEGQTATATSLNSLVQQVGGSIGIAISGVVHQYIYNYYLDKNDVIIIAEHFALQDGFVIAGIIIALALIPAFKLPAKTYVRPKVEVALK
ncbi:MDR family MFS transporter [Chitinophagaceae bacterium 26-R-25]|nr:MDR family MFS transporter [Chitinophagaceae bacterium 26-R-25]